MCKYNLFIRKERLFEKSLLVETWIDESDENRRVAKQIHSLYLTTDTINIAKRIDTEEALVKVKRRMTDRRKMTGWEWTQRVAAVLFIPLLATCLILYLGKTPQELA